MSLIEAALILDRRKHYDLSPGELMNTIGSPLLVFTEVFLRMDFRLLLWDFVKNRDFDIFTRLFLLYYYSF